MFVSTSGLEVSVVVEELSSLSARLSLSSSPWVLTVDFFSFSSFFLWAFALPRSFPLDSNTANNSNKYLKDLSVITEAFCPSNVFWEKQMWIPLFCIDWELCSCRVSPLRGSGRSRSLSMAPIRLAYSASSGPRPLWGNDEPAKLWLWGSSGLVPRAFRLVSWQAGGPSWPEVVLPLVSCEEVACIDGRLKPILDLLSWPSESDKVRPLLCRPPTRAAPLLDAYTTLEFCDESP